MYVVLVADTDIDAHGLAEPEARGPFDTEREAEDYAFTVGRYLVHVLPVTALSEVVTH